MNFISPLFFASLAIVGTCFYQIPGRWRSTYLLFLSYGFYALSSRIYLLLLIGASAISYGLGLAIAKAGSERAKSVYMAAGVAGLVGTIVIFKASGAWKGFLLPLGISYYSFKLIGYLIEVYWDDDAVERDPVLVFLFAAFFPQIVSGPIQRAEPFFAQMREVSRRPCNQAQVEEGFRLIVGGLMLKLLLGDRIASIIDPVAAAHGDYTWPTLAATVAGFTLQLYADFAGYTNIALGIGKIFGVEGPPNFNSPFAATDIQEMWRRWHMSLTSWVTDYLFTPLSMSLRSFGVLGTNVCIVLSMVIIGVWHGLTLNFLIFGLMHAAFVVSTAEYKRRFGVENRISFTGPREHTKMIVGVVLTFSLMSFSQIFWRTPDFRTAAEIAKQIMGLAPSGDLTFISLGGGTTISLFLSLIVTFYFGYGAPGLNHLLAKADRWAPRWAFYGCGLYLLLILGAEDSGNFVYGQF